MIIVNGLLPLAASVGMLLKKPRSPLPGLPFWLFNYSAYIIADSSAVFFIRLSVFGRKSRTRSKYQGQTFQLKRSYLNAFKNRMVKKIYFMIKLKPLLLIAASFTFACNEKAAVFYAEYQSITQSIYASGIVKSRNQYLTFTNAPGIIERWLVAEGDLVRQGQPLLQIASTTARLNRDNAQLAAVFSSLDNNWEKLQELRNTIQLAAQKKDNDSLLWVRQHGLWQQNIGSRVELEQRELAFKSSTSAWQSAVLRHQELQKQLDFTAKQSRNLLEISNSVAGDLQVKSEITGKVFGILKERGEMVSTQTPVAMIGDSEQFYLDMQVDEFDIAQVRAGQHALITMDSHRGEVFEGEVSDIAPMMNERTKTFTVSAVFSKRPAVLYPNLTAEANIIIATKEKALLIPRKLLLDDQYVLLATGEKRKVAIGLKDYDKAEILSGITETDALTLPQQ